jgi:2-polyprenyl-3-methyl-5-hydroxy-6-metoxy-1,4-benzoquinol methylase
MDFSMRSKEQELMDAEDIPFPEFHHCLRNLESINMLTLAYRPTLCWLKHVAPKEGTISILDAGCGGGDMLRRIEKMLKNKKHTVNLIGVDLNPWSKKSARLLSPNSQICYETADIFSFQPAQPVDFIISALFTHHLSDEKIIDFLRWMDKRSLRGWFINDLHRHPLPYYFIKIATALFSRNRLIRNDAALSVARSFSKTDWKNLLEKAGVSQSAKIRWVFPFRLCVACLKS